MCTCLDKKYNEKSKCKIKHKVRDIDFKERDQKKKNSETDQGRQRVAGLNGLKQFNLHSNFPISLFILGPLIKDPN